MADFAQQPGESTAEWLIRLKAVSLGGLSGKERRSLLDSEQAARGQAGRERRDSEAETVRQTVLGQARAAFLLLSPSERQEFILWLAQGAPDSSGSDTSGLSSQSRIG